jgi:hypothetical protein
MTNQLEVPESALAAVLSGEVVADIGQVNGLWKKMLDHEVRAGRLVTWRGKWFPIAGAAHGIGPDKTCYGTPAARDALRSLPAFDAEVAA